MGTRQGSTIPSSSVLALSIATRVLIPKNSEGDVRTVAIGNRCRAATRYVSGDDLNTDAEEEIDEWAFFSSASEPGVNVQMAPSRTSQNVPALVNLSALHPSNFGWLGDYRSTDVPRELAGYMVEATEFER